jgi:hypothetical protein
MLGCDEQTQRPKINEIGKKMYLFGATLAAWWHLEYNPAAVLHGADSESGELENCRRLI